MSWIEQARQHIARIDAGLPKDASLSQRKAALRNQYPFGIRSYWPYRAWLRARREYLSRFITAKDSEAQRAAWRDHMRGQGYMFAGDLQQPSQTDQVAR